MRDANHNPEFKKMIPPATQENAFKIRFAAIFFLLAIFFVPPAQAEDVVLTWNRPDDARVTGYEIFWGTSENNDFKSSPKKIISSPEKTDCEILGLISGHTYAFAAKSFDKFGNKSVFSEIIYYHVSRTKTERQGSSGGCFLNKLGLDR